MQANAKPFVKWAGGKTKLIGDIENFLPGNFADLQNLTYIEPFVGGGALLFWLLQKFPNITKAVINDINPDLTTAYKCVQQEPFKLIYELENIEKQYLALEMDKRQAYFLEMRDKFNTKNLDAVENTAVFIFLNHTCFNGLYRVNAKGKFNVPFGKYVKPKICDKQSILETSKILQKVEILTGDFAKTLDFATPNTLFYFDPPYKPLSKTSSFKSYAKEDFNDSEQIRLSDFCKKIHALGHNFILSNSDVKGANPEDNFFDDLYKDFAIHRVYANRMINSKAEKRGKLSELLITNIEQDGKNTQISEVAS